MFIIWLERSFKNFVLAEFEKRRELGMIEKDSGIAYKPKSRGKLHSACGTGKDAWGMA
jgi:hypothetical protein